MKLSIHSLPVLLLLAVSCASAPPPAKPVPPPAVVVSAPEWTTRTTFMEGENLVFVLVGPENADVPSLLLQAMTQYLDLPVGPDTPEVASQAIQKFLATMSATKPSDRFARGGRGYWKVAVPEEQWNASRSQLQALFKVTDPSVTLMKGAEALFQKGRYFDAAGTYIAAAAAASSSARPASQIREPLKKALEILSKLTLTSVTPAQTTRVGQPFVAPFSVKLAYGAAASAPSVADVPLRFSYKVKKNGRLAVSGQTVKTDAQGTVLFELPVPDSAVRDSLVVLVDINPWLETLTGLSEEHRDLVSALEKLAAERKLQLPYTVESASKQVPMVVALADFDDKGVVQKRQESTSTLIANLQKAGFQVTGIPVNPSLLKSTNDAVVLAAWKFQGKTTGRAVYGTVAVASVVPNGSQYSAEVTGTVKVADLGTGKPVYQLTTSQVASAADKATAVVLAFRQWAIDVATNLDSELP